MNFKNTFLAVSCAFFSLPVFGMENFILRCYQAALSQDKKPSATIRPVPPIVLPDFNKPIPAGLKDALDQHAPILERARIRSHHRYLVTTFDWLPGCWVKEEKKNFSRIKDAQKFAAAIKRCRADRITLPQKYAYISTYNKKFVIAESLKGSGDKVNKADIKQMYKVAKELRWVDCHGGNYMKIAPDTVAVIDTEVSDLEERAQTLGQHELKAVIADIMLYKINRSMFDRDALDFLKQKKEKYLPYVCMVKIIDRLDHTFNWFDSPQAYRQGWDILRSKSLPLTFGRR